MRILFTSAILTALLCPLTTAVHADESPSHAAIERFLDIDSAFVAWTDVSQIDAGSVTSLMREFDDGPTPPALDELEVVRQAIVKLGVTRVYLVPSLFTLMSGPEAVIVPVPDGQAESVRLLLEAVVHDDDSTVIVEDGVVLAGRTGAVRLLQTRSGATPAELLTELRRVNASHGVVLGVSPALSATLGAVLAGQTNETTQAVSRLVVLLPLMRSASVSMEVPPTSGMIRITADSEESATQISEALNAWTTAQIGENASVLRLEAVGNDVTRRTDSPEESMAVFEAVKQLLQPARDAARGTQSRNNLKQLALAMHNFHDVHGHFPAQALARDNGTRLLSWRVLLLPYLDENDLYNRFHLDEPWDSDHNRKLLDKMPDVFRAGRKGKGDDQIGLTQYVAPITKDSLFGRPGSGVAIKEITDGTSNTLMIAETIPDNAVPWTKPHDLRVGDDPLNDIAGAAGAFRACTCDGAAHRFPNGVTNEFLRAVLTFDAGDISDWDTVKR